MAKWGNRSLGLSALALVVGSGLGLIPAAAHAARQPENILPSPAASPTRIALSRFTSAATSGWVSSAA